jgi:hypothetical protein
MKAPINAFFLSYPRLSAFIGGQSDYFSASQATNRPSGSTSSQ